MFKNKKKSNIIILSFVFIWMIAFMPNLMSNPTSVKNDSEFTEDIINKKEKNNNPKISDYSSSYNASGGNFNVTLHQFLLNNSRIEIANASNTDNITFYEKCPTDTTFNTSLIKITIENITAPNKSLIIEDSPSIASTLPATYHTSFEILGSGYLDNFSIYVSETGVGNGNLNVTLYNSTWDSVNSRPEPHKKLSLLIDEEIINDFTGWYNFTGINYLLNTSNTQNNTFFISCIDGNLVQLSWYYENEGDGDDSYVYLNDPPGHEYKPGMDFTLKLDLTPINNRPNPTEIGLEINETAVFDYPYSTNAGNWNSTEEYSSNTGQLEFFISVEWWDVSCNITKVQINYTKSDLKAISKFNISGSEELVIWNVTAEDIYDFGGTDYINKSINYTIPSSWDLLQTFNGSTPKTNFTWDRGDGWQIVKVFDAGNGTFWGLNASSKNLVDDIKIYLGMEERSMANITDTITFKVNFSNDISGNVSLSVYSPSPNIFLNYSYLNETLIASLINLGSWNITENATDYGSFKVQSTWNNDTAAGFLEVPLIILGETEVILYEPEMYREYLDSDDPFNITIYFNDTFNDSAIDCATINYSIAGQDWQNTTVNNGTAGFYNITVDPTNVTINHGFNNVTLQANKKYHNNQTFIYWFKKVAGTKVINPYPALNTITRGHNATFQINYSTILDIPLNDSIIKEVDLNPSFIWSSIPDGNGNYTIELNTTNVDVGLYACKFNITSEDNQTQDFTLNLQITIDQTQIVVLNYNPTLVRWQEFDQSITFYFNDTSNNKSIDGVQTSDVIVYNASNPTEKWQGGVIADNWTLIPLGNGNYRLDVSTIGLDSGSYSMLLNVEKFPNYDWGEITIDFYIRGNYSDIGLIEVANPGGVITPSDDNYTTFIGSDIDIEFNFTDSENGGVKIEDSLADPTDDATYFVKYQNATNSSMISNTLSYDHNTNTFKGSLNISGLELGEYMITIYVSRKNYENATKTFIIIIRSKFDVNASLINPPDVATAGSSFILNVKIEYFDNDSIWTFLSNVNVRCIVLINGIDELEYSNSTNSNGIVSYTIILPLNAQNITINILITSTYNTVEKTKEFSSIMVNPPPVIPIGIILIVLIISAVVAVGAISYKVIVVPRRKRKREAIMEVATAFDDAINLEQLLVLHKGSGTCIFFKSFGGETIDPDLISGFLSAVQSFGKEIKYQQSLNEITYGDKMLLLSDGENIRVALVLGKKGSMVLRRNLTRFIKMFEGRFGHILPEWRGDLRVFRDSDDLIDQAFNTSIILPHEINTDVSKLKLVKSPLSRRLLKLAQNITVEKQRKYFFLASLLNEATDKVGEEAAELFVAIKELRETEAIIPIKIDKIAPEAISQQELNILGQKVAQLGGYTPEQKQSLIQELAHMKPAEREAFFTSLIQGEAIVSVPVRVEEASVEVSDAKSAKTEMKNLERKAKELIKEGDLLRAIQIYENTSILAETWNFLKKSKMLKEKAREVHIIHLEDEMKNSVKDAEKAVKASQYIEASEKYIQAARIASEIFKLGETSMQKQVRQYENKAREYEKYV